ncbi:MAG TPA: ATP-binding protein [Candidatus Woesearchaeota archaeon]|nr:ATP-binding protein [Candidatus Woesearchaeota archaeon]
MIVGKIIGTSSTKEFDFLVQKKINKFEYIQVYNENGKYCLCQVVDLLRDSEKTVAKSQVLGYREDNRIKTPRQPFRPGTEVLYASDDFISQTIEIGKSGLLLGSIEGRNISVFLDTNKLLTKHLAIIAKSGSGKSYACGVIVEEIIKRGIPLIIVDPHGEYSSLRLPNDRKEEIDKLKPLGLKPKGFIEQVIEFGDTQLSSSCLPLKLRDSLTAEDLFTLFPVKLSSAQQVLLYNAIKDKSSDLDSVILSIESEETGAKIGLLSQLKYIKSLEIFDSDGLSYSELVKKARCSLINLRGYPLELQEFFIAKILSDLFLLRKKEDIPPLFVVVEEAHNFCPERSFGESRSSRIIRTLASEGRKFGLGLGIITQRPAKIDKNVLSQCSTQLILKTTNPNDLKAISNSVEGITSEKEKEIRNLAIGSAIVTGFLEMPVFVNIRPRQTRHGGHAVDFEKEDFKGSFESYEEKLSVILPRVNKKDLEIMTGKKYVSTLIPAVYINMENEGSRHKVLFELVNGNVIQDIDKKKYSVFSGQPFSEIESFYSVEQMPEKLIKSDKELKQRVSVKSIMERIKQKYKVASYEECSLLVYVPGSDENVES